MLSYERRHLVDLLWYHKRPPGQSATIVELFGILEEQDDGSQTQYILEEQDGGSGTDVILQELAP